MSVRLQARLSDLVRDEFEAHDQLHRAEADPSAAAFVPRLRARLEELTAKREAAERDLARAQADQELAANQAEREAVAARRAEMQCQILQLQDRKQEAQTARDLAIAEAERVHTNTIATLNQQIAAIAAELATTGEA